MLHELASLREADLLPLAGPEVLPCTLGLCCCCCCCWLSSRRVRIRFSFASNLLGRGHR